MKKAKLLVFLPFTATLFSCASQAFSFAAYQYSELDDSSFVKEDKGHYYKAGENLSVHGFSTFDEVYRDKANNAAFPWHKNIHGTGEQKLLVIPVEFKDYLAEDHLPSDSLDIINGAFFGDDSSNQYHSVASFYDKSSYGRLHLKGKVTDWFTLEKYSYADLKLVNNNSACTSRLRDIRTEALAWYEETYPEDPLSNYTFDGTDVAVYFIYSAPTNEKMDANYRNSMMWAFTINNPAPTAWSSFDLTNLSKGKIDSHTYIHEVGHMFGLKDYYDSLSTLEYGNPYSGYFAPLGRMDMMDYSLGDHNSYSKMLLDWARPYVPTESGEITLRPFVSSGDFILLSPSWNGSVFDEYLLLEFYVPTYLNYVDATYREEGSRLFDKPGIKVYHVDSRLGLFNKNGVQDYYTGQDRTLYQVDIHNDNKGRVNGSTFDTSSTLIQLLDKSKGNDALSPFYVASTYQKTQSDDNGIVYGQLRDSLFYSGDSFGYDSFTSFKFHTGQNLGFKFKVNDMTSTYAKIEVTKL